MFPRVTDYMVRNHVRLWSRRFPTAALRNSPSNRLSDLVCGTLRVSSHSADHEHLLRLSNECSSILERESFEKSQSYDEYS